jgi:hypothetical protein
VTQLRNCSKDFPDFLRRIDGAKDLSDVRYDLYRCVTEKEAAKQPK